MRRESSSSTGAGAGRSRGGERDLSHAPGGREGASWGGSGRWERERNRGPREDRGSGGGGTGPGFEGGERGRGGRAVPGSRPYQQHRPVRRGNYRGGGGSGSGGATLPPPLPHYGQGSAPSSARYARGGGAGGGPGRGDWEGVRDRPRERDRERERERSRERDRMQRGPPSGSIVGAGRYSDRPSSAAVDRPRGFRERGASGKGAGWERDRRERAFPGRDRDVDRGLRRDSQMRREDSGSSVRGEWGREVQGGRPSFGAAAQPQRLQDQQQEQQNQISLQNQHSTDGDIVTAMNSVLGKRSRSEDRQEQPARPLDEQRQDGLLSSISSSSLSSATGAASTSIAQESKRAGIISAWGQGVITPKAPPSSAAALAAPSSFSSSSSSSTGSGSALSGIASAWGRGLQTPKAKPAASIPVIGEADAVAADSKSGDADASKGSDASSSSAATNGGIRGGDDADAMDVDGGEEEQEEEEAGAKAEAEAGTGSSTLATGLRRAPPRAASNQAQSGAASVQASPSRGRRGSSSSPSALATAAAVRTAQVKVEKEKLPRPSATGERSHAGVAASRLPSKEVVLRCIDRLDMDIARVEARVAMAKAKRTEWLRRRDQRRREREDKEQTASESGGDGGSDSYNGDSVDGGNQMDVDDGQMKEDTRRKSDANSPRKHNKVDRERRRLLERREEERKARLRRLCNDPIALAAEISAENLRRAAASTAALGLGNLSYSFGGSSLVAPGACALPAAIAYKSRGRCGPLFSGDVAITGVAVADVDKGAALAQRWISAGGSIAVEGVDLKEQEEEEEKRTEQGEVNEDGDTAAPVTTTPFVDVVSGSEWVQRSIRVADRFGLNLGRGNKNTWLVESWPWEERAQAERKSARKHKWEVERRRMQREQARRLQQQREKEGKSSGHASAKANEDSALDEDAGATIEAIAISWRPRLPPPGMLLARHLADPRAAAANEAAGIAPVQPGMGAKHADAISSSTRPSAAGVTSVAAVAAVVAKERARRFEQTAADAATFRTTRRLWKKRLADFEEKRRAADQAARRAWIAEERERGSDPYGRSTAWDSGSGEGRDGSVALEFAHGFAADDKEKEIATHSRVRSEYDQEKRLNELLEQERRATLYLKSVVAVPAMIAPRGSDEAQVTAMLANNNSKVADPEAAERERRRVNPWTDIEKLIFIEKFMQFPKDFHRIASYLANKTPQEVVEYYYDTKKLTNYKEVLKEQQLARRASTRRKESGAIRNDWTILCETGRSQGVKLPDPLLESYFQSVSRAAAQARAEGHGADSNQYAHAQAQVQLGLSLHLSDNRFSGSAPAAERQRAAEHDEQQRVDEERGTAADIMRPEQEGSREEEIDASWGAGREEDEGGANRAKDTTSVLSSRSGRKKSRGNGGSEKKQGKAKGKRTLQKWTEDEKATFLEVFKEHGKDWALLNKMIPNKSINQCKNYFQNYKHRFGLQDMLAEREERLRREREQGR